MVFISIAFLTYSQNYIGMEYGHIIIESKFSTSTDSTEMWEKKGVSIQPNFHDKIEGVNYLASIVIHDTENFKITTCYFEENFCVYFRIVYYNLSLKQVQTLLAKKYDFVNKNEWVCYKYKTPLALTFNYKENGIAVIEACGVSLSYIPVTIVPQKTP